MLRQRRTATDSSLPLFKSPSSLSSRSGSTASTSNARRRLRRKSTPFYYFLLAVCILSVTFMMNRSKYSNFNRGGSSHSGSSGSSGSGSSGNQEKHGYVSHKNYDNNNNRHNKNAMTSNDMRIHHNKEKGDVLMDGGGNSRHSRRIERSYTHDQTILKSDSNSNNNNNNNSNMNNNMNKNKNNNNDSPLSPSTIQISPSRNSTNKHSNPIDYTLLCSNPDKTSAEWQEILNDDYCDCPDGSDEPNTSACSNLLVHQSTFPCADGRYFIFASRVNDGVVDCADGSDENF
eukprot:CAMPEP_0203665064 /NCGR_PEP_ID=MMETSP0090-20130426/2343_1 /ASSEMBLY_ACC=CAM_ASM_001088 /TAXON_ID=426623 /ORGANISM="Chaetoceros affinis, Strain CCMP159" /LENGTH=287 /DNA_ID=CAMNT_0050528499 /DNA_START=57 /DNA_END=920 /DNA_ORIENTATION=+